MTDEVPLSIVWRRPATNGPQPCDDKCARWGGLPHPHLHYDGLFNEHSPTVTVAAYCSCGFCAGEPLTLQSPTTASSARWRPMASGLWRHSHAIWLRPMA